MRKLISGLTSLVLGVTVAVGAIAAPFASIAAPVSVTAGVDSPVDGMLNLKIDMSQVELPETVGEEFFVPIICNGEFVAENPWDSGVMGADFVIKFNTTYFEFAGFEFCIFGACTPSPASLLEQNGGQRFVISYGTEGGVNAFLGQEVMYLIFKTKTDVPDGTYNFSWAPSPGNESPKFINLDSETLKLEKLSVALHDGSLVVGSGSTIGMLGDINLDGSVDAADASEALAAYARVSTGGTTGFTAEQEANGDVDFSGAIDASDASQILSYYAYYSTTTDNPPRTSNEFFGA